MRWLSVTDFRCRRKCRSCLLLVCFVLMLLAVTQEASARPQDDQLPLDEQLAVLSDEYEYETDADNVEFHQAKLVDGVLREGHPVIMYKEDFVSEDYDPKKARAHHGPRKHKDSLGHRRRRIGGGSGAIDDHDANAMRNTAAEQYRALKPEKIYFDILSSAPLLASDESKDTGAGKLDASKVHVEVISLADDIDVNDAALPPQEEDSKQALLNKRPKKYHHRRRQRRDTGAADAGTHVVQKRNPYLRYSKDTTNANSLNSGNVFPFNYLPPVVAVRFSSHPVPGDYYNGPHNTVALDRRFGGPSNNDRVIWRDYTPTKNPNQRLNITRGTPAPLFPQRPTSAPAAPVTRRPATTRRPEQSATTESGPIYNTINEEAQPGRFGGSSQPMTACVWAIAGCCSGSDSTIRYSCFERFGCNLVFWNLNPCAEERRDNIVDYLNNQFD